MKAYLFLVFFILLNVTIGSFSYSMELTDEFTEIELTEQKAPSDFSARQQPPKKNHRGKKERQWTYQNLYSCLVAGALLTSGITDLIAQQNAQNMVTSASPIVEFSTTKALTDFSNTEQCIYSVYDTEDKSLYDYMQGSCEVNYNCIVKDCDTSDSYKQGYRAHFLGTMFSLGANIITVPLFTACALSPVLSKCISGIINCITVKRTT